MQEQKRFHNPPPSLSHTPSPLSSSFRGKNCVLFGLRTYLIATSFLFIFLMINKTKNNKPPLNENVYFSPSPKDTFFLHALEMCAWAATDPEEGFFFAGEDKKPTKKTVCLFYFIINFFCALSLSHPSGGKKKLTQVRRPAYCFVIYSVTLAQLRVRNRHIYILMYYFSPLIKFQYTSPLYFILIS